MPGTVWIRLDKLGPDPDRAAQAADGHVDGSFASQVRGVARRDLDVLRAAEGLSAEICQVEQHEVVPMTNKRLPQSELHRAVFAR